MKIKAIVYDAEEGGYWAKVPALPGCVAQGETKDELERNLREAIEGWLDAGEKEVEATKAESNGLSSRSMKTILSRSACNGY